MKIFNKNQYQGKLVPSLLNVDGEDFEFEKFVKYETMPGDLEIVTDFSRICNV